LTWNSEQKNNGDSKNKCQSNKNQYGIQI
jgi:hypothetical protein